MLDCPRCGEPLAAPEAACARCAELDLFAASPDAAAADGSELHVGQGALVPARPPEPAAVTGERWQIASALWLLAAGFVCAMVSLLVLGARPAAVAPPAHDAAASSVPVRAPQPAAASLVPRPVWQTDDGRWTGGHRRSVAFQLEADRYVAAWMRQVRPVLVVRCLGGSTDVFVYTDTAAQIERVDDNHTVRVQFDDGPETVERWPDSADHDALFAPDGRAMAQRLGTARRLRFSFTPHNARPVDVEFSTAGFDQFLAPVAKACRWQP